MRSARIFDCIIRSVQVPTPTLELGYTGSAPYGYGHESNNDLAVMTAWHLKNASVFHLWIDAHISLGNVPSKSGIGEHVPTQSRNAWTSIQIGHGSAVTRLINGTARMTSWPGVLKTNLNDATVRYSMELGLVDFKIRVA